MIAISGKQLGVLLSGAVSRAERLNRSFIYRRKIAALLRSAPLNGPEIGPPHPDLARVNPQDWRRFYVRHTGQDSPYYVSEELYYNNIEPYLNPPSRISYFLDKNNFEKLRLDWRLPQALGRIVRGRFLGPDYAPADPVRAFAGHEEVLLKPSLGRATGAGAGVRFVSREAATAFAMSAAGRSEAAEYIFQAPLAQSPTIARLNPGSVNTLRLTTFHGPAGPRLLSAFSRFGRAGARIDDHSAGGLECGVRDGRLAPVAYDKAMVGHASHPDSGLRFEGFEFPSWDAAVALALRVHGRLPELGLLSFDIAFDPDEAPLVIEINPDRQEINTHQMFNGPLFGAEILEIVRRSRPRTLLGRVVG